MIFENHTPFPAIAWPNIDKDEREYLTTVVRVKYLFKEQDESGLWSLKLAQDQGELFGEDIFYEDNMNASVLYESDYVTYKPYGDLIINGYAHQEEERKSWLCGVEVLREESSTLKTILEQRVRVYGERNWEWWLHGWNLHQLSKSKKVALRYENAYGGYSLNPKRDREGELKYLDYFEANPVGKGVIHRKVREGKGTVPAHQIESDDEKISTINKKGIEPQGFGFINRSWEPRLSMVGQEEQEDITLLCRDFDEHHNNGAHRDMQLKEGYFRPNDIIILENMLKGESIQGVRVPALYFYGDSGLNREESKFFLEIDTIILELRSDEMEENGVYMSYRKRVEKNIEVKSVSLNMVVPQEFKANRDTREKE